MSNIESFEEEQARLRKAVEDEVGHPVDEGVFFDEYDSDFASKADEVLKDIDDEFNKFSFIETYLKFDKHKITENEITTHFDNAIASVEQPKRHTWNKMWSMLSNTNCWYITYKAGQLLHDRLINFWYPSEKI